MKVKDICDSTTKFSEVLAGEVFYFEGKYMMKTLMTDSKNAVCLKSGSIKRLYDDSEVTLFPNAELICGKESTR